MTVQLPRMYLLNKVEIMALAHQTNVMNTCNALSRDCYDHTS
jgi:hypothetical protein